MPVNLGNDFDRAVLTAAGVDPVVAQLGTVQIDALPVEGNVTVRYTAVATAPAADIWALIRGVVTPNEPAQDSEGT